MKNKIIYFLLLVVVIEELFFAFRPNLESVRTDSGWDNDYSSSSSSGGSSSSDRGSYDSDSGRRSQNLDMDFPTVFVIELLLSIAYYKLFEAIFKKIKKQVLISVILTIIRLIIALIIEYFYWLEFVIISMLSFSPIPIVLLIRYYIISRDNEKNKIDEDKYFYSIPEDIARDYNINDIDKLKSELYKIFVDVQIAWMEFDYDKLSLLCSNELYNSYRSELETLQIKNGKNIMENFKLINCMIKKFNRLDNGLSILVHMEVEFKDYVIDTNTNEVIRGNKERTFINTYELVFNKNINFINKCPSCGADINNPNNQKCEHCGNILLNNNSNFVLISKGKI